MLAKGDSMSFADLFNLKGKNALVTGGSVGIGRACATALAMGGADVAIVDINEETGLKTVESLKSMGVDSFFVRCDVSDKQQVQEMLQAVVDRFGGIDIAVNNAGLGIVGEDIDQPKEDWDKVISVNLTGVWLCAQAQAQQMIKQSPSGGKIINAASIASKVLGMNGSYNASKAAVVHLTRTLASRWGRYNINVNCFSPGLVMTSLIASTTEEQRKAAREKTPLGYIQRPEDLYGPILFLASSASDYMTGHELVLDGGYGTLELVQCPREIPPRVSPEEEIVELKKDLEAMGILHDEHGIPLHHP